MSKWVDKHKIMIEVGHWYVTIDDVEDLIDEFNKEIERVRARIKWIENYKLSKMSMLLLLLGITD